MNDPIVERMFQLMDRRPEQPEPQATIPAEFRIGFGMVDSGTSGEPETLGEEGP